MISKINITFNNETTVQKMEIQIEVIKHQRAKLHELLDEWLDNVSDNSHFDITHTMQRNFQLSED